MKIKLKVRELARSKGINSAYQLQKKANLAPSTAARYFNNKVPRITIDSLEKVCTALECKPGDIFSVKE